MDSLQLAQAAVGQGLCTLAEFDEALARKRQLSDKGQSRSMTDIMIECGYLTRTQLKRLRESAVSSGGSTIVGGYRLADKIGEGGMGTVYRAVNIATGKMFAMKVLHRRLAQDDQFIERFEHEVRAVFSLDHPNIVRAFDVGRDGVNHYLVMEYIDGKDIYELLDVRGKLGEFETLRFIRAVASALQHIHEAGLVHRDIKPENILIDKNGTVKLTDLGLAVKEEAKLRRRLTATGIAMGTPSYLSPEQIRGEDLDIRSDLYGLGATAYEMVTGKVPFEGESVQNVMLRHLESSIPSPRDIDRSISQGFCHIIEKLMAKDRNFRYRFPFEVMLDIDRVINHEPPASDRLSRGRSTVNRPQKLAALSDRAVIPAMKQTEEILYDAMNRNRAYPTPPDGYGDVPLYKKAGFIIIVIWLIVVTVLLLLILSLQ